MGTGIDLQFVRETYQRKSDQELIDIVTQRAEGLTPEAMEMVKEEIRRRGLHDGLVNSIDVQQKTFTSAEIDQYCALIQNLPCPVTGSTAVKLNATLIAETISYIVMTHYNTQILVASPEVLKKANNKAMIKSALLGWWGIPNGIISTIRALAVNASNKKNAYRQEPTEHLRTFVLSRIGEIEAYKHDQAMLSKIISQ